MAGGALPRSFVFLKVGRPDTFFLFLVIFFPQTVCPHYGVLTVGLGVVSFEVSFCNRGFQLRRLAQSSVCDDSVARIACHGIFGRFAGCPCTF